jgi:hypothetical protein
LKIYFLFTDIGTKVPTFCSTNSRKFRAAIVKAQRCNERTDERDKAGENVERARKEGEVRERKEA